MSLRSTIVVITGVAGVCGEWIKTRDSRLPAELRVVNEGIAHDDEYWYFSNQHFLYQTSVDRVSITNKNYEAIPPELQELSYNHIGDIDILDGIIYGGLEDRNDGNGVLAAWNTSTLEMISYRITEQKDMPWVAIDPATTNIWSSVWGEVAYFNVWSSKTFEKVDTYYMPEGTELPKEIQGGAFYKGSLYLASNLEDAVWKVDISSGVLTKELSDSYNHHDYEMEGLDFWDLTDKGLGVMHMFGNFMQVKEKAIHHYDEK